MDAAGDAPPPAAAAVAVAVFLLALALAFAERLLRAWLVGAGLEIAFWVLSIL